MASALVVRSRRRRATRMERLSVTVGVCGLLFGIVSWGWNVRPTHRTVVDVDLDPGVMTMISGEVMPIVLKARMSDGRPATEDELRRVKWSTTDPSVASVAGRLVYSHDPGRVVISAKIGTREGAIFVEVVARANRPSWGASPPPLPRPAQFPFVEPGNLAAVTVSHGAAVRAGGCSDPSCANVRVTLSGFREGAHTVACFEEGGAFYTYTTEDNISEICYYGYPGRMVWVTVDGISSNHLRW
jgi:hypothetical protein